ncbi:hypothetical protein [Altererythrobacter sp. Root672]|uniref:hypothetical protein n=1 Tax=Altererythrobacter sp. Root672 TaxID=1736584 RepID=UPI0006F4C031|nr:hypothetical protein [Altererythrobacter sp. Root672]KRA83811.1 hypothetical protein ASD76_07285 [Altererythrobacter sp. Root672]
MKVGLFGAVMLLLSTGVMAQEAQTPPAEADAKQEKKICRTDRVTGSLTRSTRICLTRAQWQEVHRRTKQGLDDTVRQAGGGCQAPSNVMKGSMC